MLGRTILIAAFVSIMASSASLAATYTINPPAGTVTNVTQKFTGKNVLAINTLAPPDSGGTVYLNAANTFSSGGSLEYGTLVIQTSDASELGTGTFTQKAGGTLRYVGPSGGEWSKTIRGPSSASGDFVLQIDNDLSVQGAYASVGYLIKTGAGTLTFTKSFRSTRTSYPNNANRTKVLDFSAEMAPTKGFGNFTVAEGTFVIDTQDEPVTNVLANFDRAQTYAVVGACTTLDGTEKTGVLEIRSGITEVLGRLAIGQCNGSTRNSTARLQPTVRVTGGKLAVNGSNAIVVMGISDSSDGFSDLWNSPRLLVSGGEFSCEGNVHLAYNSGADCVVQVTNGGFLSSNGFMGNYSAKDTRTTSNLVEVAGTGSRILTGKIYNDYKESGQVTTVRVAGGGTLEMDDFVNSTAGELHLVVDGGVWKRRSDGTAAVQIPANMTSVKAASGGFIADIADGSVPVVFAKGIDGEGGFVVTNSSGAAGAHLQLAAASTYAGATAITDAYVELAAPGALPSTTALSLSGDSGGLAVTNGEQTVASFKLGSDNAADSPTLAFARGSCLAVSGALTAGSLLVAPKVAIYEEAGSADMLSTPGEYVVLKARAEDISVLQAIASKVVMERASINCSCSASVEGGYAVLKVKGMEATDNTWASVTSGGTWSAASNWTDTSTGAPRNGTATFPAAQAADVPVTLDADATLGSISFAAADPAYGYLLSGSSVLSLYSDPAAIVNDSGTNTIAAPVEIASATTIETTAPGALRITGDISGNGDVAVNTHVSSGAGEVSLSPASGYTGKIVTGSGRTVLDDLSFLASADQLTLGIGTFLYTGSDVTIPGFTVAAAANRQAIFESDADVTMNAIAVSGSSRGFAKYGTGTLTLLGNGITTLTANKAIDANENANNVRSANGDSCLSNVTAVAIAGGTFAVGEAGVSANAPTIDASGSGRSLVIGTVDSTGDATFVLNNGTCNTSLLRLGYAVPNGDFAVAPTFTYRQNGGSMKTTNYTTSFDDADKAVGNVLIEINGGTLDTISMRLGQAQAATAGLEARVVVNGGELIVRGSNMYPTWGANAPHGYVVLNGGVLQVNSDYSASRSGADSDFHLNTNGEFQISGAFLALNSKATHAVFHANGGVFSPIKSAATMRNKAFTSFRVSAGGFVVNTAGLTNDVPVYTINQTMQTDPELAGTDGGLVKRGAGNLVLAAANTYTGPTVVEGGTLSLSNSGTFGANSNLVVASGAACNLGGKSVSVASASGAGTVSNGTLTVTGTFGVSGGGALTIGDAGNLTLASGVAIDFAGVVNPNLKEGVQIAAVSGTATLPASAVAVNAGDVSKVKFVQSGTSVYAVAVPSGVKIIFR